MKIAIIKIDDTYEAPRGTLHLGTTGWIVDQPEKLKVRINVTPFEFMKRVAEQSAGLLGDGELVFALFDENGTQFGPIPSMREYLGRILFSPEE